MIIEIPDRLTFSSSIEFCNYLDSLEESGDYSFDYKNMSLVEPFGMLLVGAKMRQFMRERGDSKYSDRNFKQHTYAANFGFFKSVMQDYGKAPGELPGNKNYIPITKISAKGLYEKSRESREHVVDIVEREAKRLASVLARGNKLLEEILTYSIREIIRNVIEHSGSDEIWFCGQYWPTKNRVEIAIIDEGMGIYRSLSANPRVQLKSGQDALLLAIEPGVTGKRLTRYDREDPYANSGFGLFVTSRISIEGGDYSLCSGTKALGISSRKPTLYDTSYQGTAIRMRLNTTRLGELDGIIPRLIKEGEALAKKNTSASSVTASKISSLLGDE
jgi:hypothetical protein